MKVKIRVANPVSLSLTYIPLKSAERYVARGRAHWQNERTIRFIEDSHDRAAAQRTMRYESQFAYDRIGQMQVEQVKGIPVLGDVMKLFTLR